MVVCCLGTDQEVLLWNKPTVQTTLILTTALQTLMEFTTGLAGSVIVSASQRHKLLSQLAKDVQGEAGAYYTDTRRGGKIFGSLQDISSMTSKQYLDQLVVPQLLPALNAVSTNRPSDPIQYLVSASNTITPVPVLVKQTF